MNTTSVANLEVGHPVEGVYAVRRKERRLSRRGEPYLVLTLSDASGAIPGYIFDQADFFGGQFEVGDRVRVAGQVVERSGRPSVRVRHVRPAADEVDAGQLLPRSHRPPDELMGYAEVIVSEVGNPRLRALAGAVLGDADLHDGWMSAPCSRSGHHAYQGGLLEHSVGVALLCQSLSQWHPRLDADMLVCAGLLHDVGHIRTWHLGATFELTDEGRMLGHLALGHEIVDRAARELRLPDQERLSLLHAIGWHHGAPAGQPPGTASPEALALWRINTLEVSVKSRLEGAGPIEGE